MSHHNQSRHSTTGSNNWGDSKHNRRNDNDDDDDDADWGGPGGGSSGGGSVGGGSGGGGSGGGGSGGGGSGGGGSGGGGSGGGGSGGGGSGGGGSGGGGSGGGGSGGGGSGGGGSGGGGSGGGGSGGGGGGGGSGYHGGREHEEETTNSHSGGGGGGGGGGTATFHSRTFNRQRYPPRNSDINDDNRMMDGHSSNNRTSGSSNDWRQNNNNNNNNDSNASSTVTFEISSNKIGKIIGKGGSQIREIQSQFSVNVKIIDQDSYTPRVQIRGQNQNDRDAAQKFIEELITDRDIYASTYAAPKRDDNDQYQGENEIIDWGALAKNCEEETKKKWAALSPVVKNFYKEDPKIAAMSKEEVDNIRLLNNKITVKRTFLADPENDKQMATAIPNPVQTFEQCFSEYPDLLNEIKKQGFENPSPIQCQAWPILLRGEDLIGIAQTGTGKTLAFLLPALIHTEYQLTPRSERTGANVLVFAPTRELAIQIDKEVKKYEFRGMKSVCIYGGGDRRSQIEKVDRGVEIIIATPGRLNDLVQAKTIDLNQITYLVLDEADRMLDMGFEAEIRKVLLAIRPDRQTIMTSATWPPGVRNLAEKYMNNPIQVCVGSLDLAAVQTVEQIIEIIDENEKFDMIMSFIHKMDPKDKIIIFCGKKARADDLSSEISLKNINAQCIHGNRDQIDREQALEDIRSGEVHILIATDVASRGIDIEDITYVINYDFPRNIEEYVHRVGRTGRAGRKGKSISYMTREDWASAGELIKILEKTDQEVPEELWNMKNRFDAMKERREDERKQFGMGGGRGGGGGGGRRGRGGGGGGGFGRHC